MTKRDIGPRPYYTPYVPFNITAAQLTHPHYIHDDLKTVEKAWMHLANRVDPNASRDEYLEWLALWKVNYKNLTRIINQVKSYRDNPGHDPNGWWNGYHGYRQTEAELLRRAANRFLNIRDTFKIIAKVKANKEYADV